ncbi:MAG: hypothetical protein PHN94_11535, partial [Bacteroidales bacterium]|nr:hypothetical protein [Bacteroidales bacterium]
MGGVVVAAGGFAQLAASGIVEVEDAVAKLLEDDDLLWQIEVVVAGEQEGFVQILRHVAVGVVLVLGGNKGAIVGEAVVLVVWVVYI